MVKTTSLAKESLVTHRKQDHLKARYWSTNPISLWVGSALITSCFTCMTIRSSNNLILSVPTAHRPRPSSKTSIPLLNLHKYLSIFHLRPSIAHSLRLLLSSRTFFLTSKPSIKMRFERIPLSLLLPLTTSSIAPEQPQHIFTNPPIHHSSTSRIPTSYESAILARRILHLTPLATLSTNFPTSSSTTENRPSGLEGLPIGLTDYISDCESHGNPTILAISIATSFKNIAAGSNLSISIQWTPPYLPKSRIESSTTWLADLIFGQTNDDVEGALPYSAANLPRFSLLGYLETIPEEEVEAQGVKECFVAKHRDSRYWLPGNRIHHSEWTRMVVKQIYWVGGFGDRAYIGWIPVEEWRNVTEEEWRDVRLPGEKRGWKEWNLQEDL